MKELNDNYGKLSQEIIESLFKGFDVDKPYLFANNKMWTKREIIDEITNKTEFGINFINNLVLLSLDLFTRSKEKLQNFEKV